MASLPSEMNATEIVRPGGPEVLRPARRPRPDPGRYEVLIEVAAAGVNRPDVLQRMGRYAPPPGASDIPGLEVAGRIARVGPEVERWKEGDLVSALLPGGGYAEYAVAAADLCLPVPAGFSLHEAAALPETFFTVWHNVFERGRLLADETLLVHGGSSGIGTAAITLARARGAHVIVTAGSAEKCQACVSLGAELAIPYREQDFAAVVREHTRGQGVDVVLDMVGAPYFARNLECLAVEGRLVQIAVQGGVKAEVDLLAIMQKRLVVTGSTLRPRPVAEKARIAQALEEEVWPLLRDGQVRPVIHARFPLADAADAHRLMESSRHIGKLVLVEDAGGAV
jgi:putative PIG3 family NAD(P)H quinone oxidoreductase